MAELNHEILDLGQVLAGIGYPEDDVEVVFDESVGYEIERASQTLREAEIRGNEEQLKETLERLDELKRSVAHATVTLSLRGLPESERRACDKKSRDEYPVTYTFLGSPEPNPDRDDYYNALIWSKSIVKVTDPKGAVGIPDEKFITQLREKAGRHTIGVISRAIESLVTGTASGFEKSKVQEFESAVQDVDFLSDASPEE